MNPHAVKAYVDAIDPRLWYILLALIAGGITYAWRKLSPATFLKLPPTVQALSAAIMTTVLQGVSDGADLKQKIVDCVLAAFMGLAAAGGHHVLKASPLPYQGAANPKKPPTPPEDKAA